MKKQNWRAARCGSIAGLLLLILAGCGGGSQPTNPPPKYTVGGTVTGLATGASLVLSNEGADSTSVTSNGVFNFLTPIASGSQYAVAVASAPANDTCVVSNPTGTIASANVTNVSVSCSPTTYTIGGSVSGLAPGTSVVLLDNGGDSITATSNTNFTFKTAIATGSSYSVSVGTQPAGQRCAVSGGSGILGSANVTGITVSCVPVFTIGGTVTGLADSTSITLQDNGGDATIISSNGAFTFPIAITSGGRYAVTIDTQPAYQGCSLVAGAGQAVANVTNVQVRCPVFTLLENLGVGTVGSSAQSLPILASDGNYYGTTEYGGLYVGGTVYKLTPAGDVSTVANFVNGSTSWGPMGALLQASDGNFHGTTYWGGVNNAGTIYELTPDGTITTLWSFGSGADGQLPKGGLVQASDGNFYGTTGSGGTTGYGTVFRLTPAGVETVLWNFSMDSGGYFPEGALVVGGDGNLYGAASLGGTNSSGVLFRLTLAGVESVIWNFGGSPGGWRTRSDSDRTSRRIGSSLLAAPGETPARRTQRYVG